jgi:type IV pilus assembly protein PilP
MSMASEKQRSASGLAAGLMLALGLAACGQDMRDLENYVDEVMARPGPSIEPIPEIAPYESFDYTAADRRSPFEPDHRLRDEEPVAGDGLSPDFERRREFLEGFPLDGLRFQGTLEMAGARYAIVRDPDGIVHRVRAGNHMGQNHGEILRVTGSEIVLREIVPDGLGGWNERETSLSLRQ